jgi:hypothetical protein
MIRYFMKSKEGTGKGFSLGQSSQERTVNGSGYGGQPLANRVVRWDLYGNRVLLKGD